MIRPGISRELLIAGTVPAAVVTAIVGVWLMTLRIADLREHQAALGQAVASQLAPAAEYGVFSGSTAVLQRLAEAALADSDLRSVTVLDRLGMPLARAVRDDEDQRQAGPVPRWLAMRFVDPDATMRFDAPIIQPLVDLGEFDMPAHDAGVAYLGSVEIEIALLPALARQFEAFLTGIAILLGGLLISLLLARRLGERIAGPIQRLADAMRRVRDGDLAVRVPESSVTELGLLESGLNRMADEVERTHRTLEERVARATDELQQTVAALEVSNVELDLARRRAIEASHLKGEFLAAMSHEIRTPMSGIIGFADLLARTRLDADQREQVLTVRKCADALMRLLNDVLDLSRIEAGKLSIANEVFDPRTCIDEALSVMMPLAYAKQLDLQRGVRREVPAALRGDPTRVQQIVTNLVSNAIKYTDHGSVSVEASWEPEMGGAGEMLRIAVTDTGIGISDDDQRKLFQAFSQPTSAAIQHPGAGLGLVICNKLVEAMGGEIELVSAPGHGSRFSVSLALTAAAAPVRTGGWPGRRAVVADPDPLTRDHIAQLLEAAALRVTAIERDALGDAPSADVLVIGLPDFQTARLAHLAPLAARYPHVLVLLGTLDPADIEFVRQAIPGLVLPRCAAPAAVHRALGTLFSGSTGEPSPAIQSLAGLHALVVDDNRLNRMLLCRQLQLLGAEVDAAVDGEDALSHCDDTDYDIVLLDLQMPGIGGVETARRLRTLTRPPLVIAVTANAQPALQRHPGKDGLSAVLVKPVSESVLAGTILDHHGRRKAAGDALAALDPEMLTMLAEDLPGQARAFHDAALASDPDALRAAAHDLSGTAAACKLAGIRDALGRLRATMERTDRPPPSALDEVAAELATVESLLPRGG